MRLGKIKFKAKNLYNFREVRDRMRRKKKKKTGKKAPPKTSQIKFNRNKQKENEQEAKIIIPYKEHKEFSL